MNNRYRGEYTSDFQQELQEQMAIPSQTYITLYVFTDGTYVLDEPVRDHYMLTILKSSKTSDIQTAIKQLLLS